MNIVRKTSEWKTACCTCLCTMKLYLLFIPVTTGSFAVDSNLTAELSKFNAASTDDVFLNTT